MDQLFLCDDFMPTKNINHWTDIELRLAIGLKDFRENKCPLLFFLPTYNSRRFNANTFKLFLSELVKAKSWKHKKNFLCSKRGSWEGISVKGSHEKPRKSIQLGMTEGRYSRSWSRRTNCIDGTQRTAGLTPNFIDKRRSRVSFGFSAFWRHVQRRRGRFVRFQRSTLSCLLALLPQYRRLWLDIFQPSSPLSTAC